MTLSLAALLFTDLVGSTALRAALGEEPADRLRATHDDLLAGLVRAHGGQVLKGTGDGLVASFAAAADALTAAVEMQQALYRYNRSPDATAALSVRMGLSVGDVSWDGGDCFGTPLVEAARLEAAAEGGQILCSDLMVVLARGRGGHQFRSIGELTLKGLPEPLAASEVCWNPEADASAQLAFPASLAAGGAWAFVGRERELGEAQRHLESTAGMSVLWISGEPGIGKTRLAGEIARRAWADGADVLVGRCDEDLAVPYQPFVTMLREHAAAWGVHRLRQDLPAHHLAPLGRLLPELAPAPTASSDGLQPDAERYQLFEAVRAWLTLAAGEGRALILVLDDVHWADAATVALLAHLLRDSSLPVGIVATLRSTEQLPERLADLVDGGTGAVPSRTLAMRGLGEAGVGRLVAEQLDRSALGNTSELARRIHAETAGNPLFVAAMISGLGPTGEGAADLPSDVRSAVRRRTSRLSEAAQDLLRVGAVAGLEFDLRVIGKVLERPMVAVLDIAEEAISARLVEEVSANRLRFAHALVRAALRHEVRASRAGLLHQGIAQALEAVFTDRLDEHVEALALHYGEAVATDGPLERALHYRLRAGERASAQQAHDAAVEHFRRALELMGTAKGREHCEVLVRLGESQFLACAYSEAMASLRTAAGDADTGGWPDLLANAAIHLERTTAWPGLPGDEAAHLLGRAAERLGAADSALTARVLSGLGSALAHSGRAAEARTAAESAVAMARRVGDDVVLGYALFGFYMASLGPEQIPAVHAALAEAYEIGSRLRHPWLQRSCNLPISMFLLQLGHLDDLAVVQDRDALARATLPDQFLDMEMAGMAAMTAMSQGRFADAELFAAEARELGARLDGIDPEGNYGMRMFSIRREQGRLAEVAPVLSVLARMGESGQAWRPGLAALYADLDRPEQARVELGRLVSGGEVWIAADALRSVSLSYLADAACAVGDQAAAAALYRALEPYGELWIAATNVAAYGPATRFLGALAATLERLDDAEEHFAHALGRCDATTSPTWLTHVQVGLATMLATRRGSGDAQRAATLARQAHARAVGLGMRTLAARAEELSGRLVG